MIDKILLIKCVEPGPLPGSFYVPVPAASIYEQALKKAHNKTGHITREGVSPDGSIVVYFARDTKALRIYHEIRKDLQDQERRKQHSFDLSYFSTYPAQYSGVICHRVGLRVVEPHFTGTISSVSDEFRKAYRDAHRLARMLVQSFSHETAYAVSDNKRTFIDLMTSSDEAGMYVRHHLMQSILFRRALMPQKKVQLALKVHRQPELKHWLAKTRKDPDSYPSPWIESWM